MNPEQSSCSGGDDCRLAFFEQDGIKKVSQVLPFNITLDSSKGECVAFSRAENALVSFHCENKTLQLCQKSCPGGY